MELFKKCSINKLEKNFETTDIRRVATFMSKVNQEVEKHYKSFLLLRYGFVPKEEELIDFYKKHKIRPTWYSKLTEKTFVVREKGHKVFVMKMWDEVDEGCMYTNIKIEKFVLHRKKHNEG